MQYEDSVTIATPEGVELELALAGLGSRCAAAVIDNGLKLLIVVALAVPLVVVGSVDAGVAVAVGLTLTFLLISGYDVLFETFGSGKTPGKRVVGLRVVLAGGRPIGFRASAVRNLLRLIDGAPLAYVPGVIAILVSARNQRLGDLAAGALVLRERAGAASSVPASRSVALHADLRSWDVASVTPEDLSTVRLFLERRDGLEPQARARLADRLAAGLRRKVAGGPDGLSSEAFLEQLAAAKAARS